MRRDAEALAAAVRNRGPARRGGATRAGGSALRVHRRPRIAAEVDSTPLGERITTEMHDRIRAGAREVLAPFVTGGGGLRAPFECLLATGHV